MTATQEMNAAVDRWIRECACRPDGASVLRKRAAWLEGLIAKQGQGETVPALQDVTVWDSQEAHYRLWAAAEAQGGK